MFFLLEKVTESDVLNMTNLHHRMMTDLHDR